MSTAVKTKPAASPKPTNSPKPAVKLPKLQLIAAPSIADGQDNQILRSLIVTPDKIQENAMCDTELVLADLFRAYVTNDDLRLSDDERGACFESGLGLKLKPTTLSDCLYMLEALLDIQALRDNLPGTRASSISRLGSSLCAAASIYAEKLLTEIPPRSAAEAQEVLDFIFNTFGNPFEKSDLQGRIVKNLILGRHARGAVAVHQPLATTSAPTAIAPADGMRRTCCEHGSLDDLVAAAVDGFDAITAMVKGVRAMMAAPVMPDVCAMDKLLEEIWTRADSASGTVDAIAEGLGVPLSAYYGQDRAKELSGGALFQARFYAMKESP